MMAPALLPLFLAAASPQFADDRSPDPAVQVWLDSEARYERGDFARVFARTARDGYLVVLHADTEGRVRVLFPLDPWLDDYVRGGEGIELRTRGDREAFLVEDRDGSGIVLAAWSADPFRFDPFVRGDHWDYRAISTQGVVADPEAALLDVVHTMAAGRRYEYDVAPYIVGAVAYDAYVEPRTVYVESPVFVERWAPHIDWRIGFGTHSGFYLNVSLGNTHWYDPWYYDPWYYGWRGHYPRYSVHYPVWYRPIYHDPFFYRPIYRPRYAFDPYNWRHTRRYPSRGIGVHIRYASGDCRDRWRCGGPFHRPGRATGIAYGDGGDAWPWGRFDDRDPRPGGVGRGTAQPRGGNSPVRVSDPQIDLGRGRATVRGIGDRAADPVATSTTETRRPNERIPVWPGDDSRGNGIATRSEPTRNREAGDVIRRAETATSTETTADPRRSNGNGIGRRVIEQSGTTDPNRSGSRSQVIIPQRSTEERASSTGQGRDSRSIGDRARATEDQNRGSASRSAAEQATSTGQGRASRWIQERARSTEGQGIGRRPIQGSSSASEARAETARSSNPQSRSNPVDRRSIGSAVEPPTRNEAQGRTSSPQNTRIIKTAPPQTRSEPDRSAATRARSTAGRDAGNIGSTGRSSSGTAGRSTSGAAGRSSSGTAGRSTSGAAGRSSSGTAGRSTSGTAGRSSSGSAGRIGTRSTGGSDARSSSGSARARSTGAVRGSGVSSRVSSGAVRSTGGSARSSVSSRSTGGSARSTSRIGSGTSRSTGSARASSRSGAGSGSSRASARSSGSSGARSSGGIGSRARRSGGA